MENLNELMAIADRLLSPGGCPWDREQTLFTLQPYLLEEAHELIEAIDAQDEQQMAEELGDVLYALVFIAKLGEKNNLFTMSEAMRIVCEKLIRRHPHVFGETKIDSTEDVVRNWEEIKKKEKGGKGRKTILEGIPPTLPILAKAQKMLTKLKRANSGLVPQSISKKVSEEELGRRLWELIAEAEDSGLNAEGTLRRFCSQIEKNTGE